MNTEFSLSQPPALDETAAPATPPDSMEALLLRLRQRGIQLQAEGAQLRISAPKGALDDDLRAALSAGKSEILRLLQSQERRSALPQVQPQPAQRHEPFPLTDVQHAYWMGRQPFVELGGFSTHCYFEFQRAGLDIERLETALQALILRHDMLRAVINEDGTQRVLPEVPPYRIECLDLRALNARDAESALLAQREQLSHKRGPVDRWPLFAIRAARLPGEQLRLFVSLDMLIIDASSMFLFFQEWQQAYEDPQRLAPAQAFSYRDYALFEQTLHEQPEFQRARDYWSARLDSLPPAPGLPLARQPHELAEVRFERREQRIAAADWARLKTLAAQHGATPTVLLMTAFAEALRPWSATPDFSLNVTLFHRFPVHPEVDQLIGDFTATSLLAARAQAGDSFADRLQRLQAQLAEDLDHRAYSGMRVLRDRARHLGHAPGAAMPVVFTSTLALDGRQSTTGGLSFFGDIVHGVSQTPQVWMDHQMAEFDGELRLFLDAIEDLFPAGLLDDCFGAYAQLLRTLAADPAAWAQRPLPATLPARHLPLLAQLNATEDPAIGHGLLQDGLIIQARRQPEALAVIAADGQLSYGRLAREALVLAEALQALGAGGEQPVAVMMDKGCEQVLAVYGVLMAGAAYLPIDPRLPAERRRHLLSASGARLLLTQAAHHPGQDLTPGLRVLCLGDEALAAPAIAPPPAATRPGDLAYVLFTSGSTGAPKGVMIEHAQAVNTLQDINRRMQVGPRDRVLALSALHFDLSVYDLFGVIAAGGCLVMPDPARLHDAQHWAELVQAHRVSLWNSVPQLLQHFVEHLEHLQAQGDPLPGGLRQAILSGDWIPVGLPDRARRVCPDLQLLASGGPTETAIWCTQYPIGEVDPAWSSIPYGRPLANQRMWVMDELLEERPVGVTGEICIGGACVGRGYLGDEAQTAQRFLRHPRTGERLYRSGDLGRVTAEGQIEFLGRQDHQVKLNGLRIELGEINACLLRQPGIRQAWTGVRREGAQKQLVSLLVLDPDDAAAAARLADGSLRQALAAWLPDYMLPQRFQRLEALPLSANGKVDAAQLQALLQAQQAEGAAPAAQTDAAAQALQEQLLPLWRSLLGRQDLTPAQSFFDVGGDSLLALRLLSRVREQLGLAPALQGRLMQCFFQQPRLADFAAALTHLQQDPPAQGEDELPLIEPTAAPAGEDFPAADVQLAFLMGDGEDLEFHVRTHHYVEVEMPAFDPARYEQALQRELQRQAANIVVATPELRLRPVQDLTPLPLSLDDCRALDAPACEARLLATRARMERQPLPVHHWPWMDVHATLLPGGHARLHINCNAVFWDGFGTQQFFANVERCYREPGLVLPPLTLTFRDCVLALERLEQGPQGERSRRYWMERLPSMPAAPALPLKPRLNRRQRSMMKRRERDLSAAQWQALRQRCEARGLRPEAGLFAAYAQILSFWSGSRHFLLNNMVSHRLPMHEQIFEIVGNFSALYPLEVDWREGGGFAERCRRLDQRMQQDAQHLHCSGVQVLQAYNRVHGQAGRAACPFVVGNGLAMKPFTRSLHGCLETPQVLLDNQFFGLEDGGIWITWDVFEDVFPAGQVDAMWQAYARLLDQLAHDDAAWDSEGFDLLDEAARALRRDYNDSAAPRPEGRLLQDGLLEQARRQGDALALVAEGQRLSYAQLAAQALALAGQLQARGLRSAEPVAVLLPRGPWQVIAVQAILAAGGAYVPMDPQWPTQRLQQLLDSTGARLALCLAGLDAPALPGLHYLAVDQLPSGPAWQPPAASETQLAYIIFTSGSTGVPKGVMIDHRGALNTIADVNRRFGVRPADVLFGVSSLYFDLSVYDLFGSTLAGARLVLPDAATGVDPSAWLHQMQDEGVTVWNSVPALMQLLVDAALAAGVQLPQLRLVMLSGDWIPVTLPEQVRRIAPNAQVVSLGGATEASIWSIVYPIGSVPADWPSIPYGRPLANQRWHVLDEDGRELPDGVTGQLHIAGTGLALGYWGDEARTAAAFIRHPRSGERLYRTGDLGRLLPEGQIEFLGRADFQVKIQGYRIEIDEIEHVLLAHPGVRGAAVIVVGSQAGKQLQGFLIADEELDLAAVQAHVGARLPAYMVPSRLQRLAQLPLTANGKVDRSALAAMAVNEPREQGGVAPRNALERSLAEIWSAVLGVQPGVHDDFFALGGQSFAAVRVMTRIEQQLGLRLPLSLMLEGRTIAALAQAIEQARAQRTDAPAVARRSRALVCLQQGSSQEPGWYFVHPAGGHVLCYRELAQSMPGHFHAFQAPGLSNDGAPLDEVPALAAHYLTALRQHQPQGPYRLGGWSSGGTIAFEMARQLEAEGEQVACLALLDTPAPLAGEPQAPSPRQLLQWFLQDLEAPLSTDMLAQIQTQDLTLAAALSLLHGQGLARHLDARALQAVHAVFCATVDACQRYRPGPVGLNAPLLVLQASEGEVAEFAGHPDAHRSDWGWRAYAAGRLRSLRVPGSHYSLFKPPQLDGVAALLQTPF